MACRYAVANGNWSAPGTWDGGASIPADGDTVYANGKTVTIDQDISIGAGNVVVPAGSFIPGQRYVITEVGDTTWAAIGAESSTLGTVFTATGTGNGNGQAETVASLSTMSVSNPSITAGGGFQAGTPRTITADIVGGNTTCLSITADCTVIGDVYYAGGGAGIGINVASSVSLDLTGDILPMKRQQGSGIVGATNSVVSVTGTVHGGTHTSSYSRGINTSGHVLVQGDVFGGQCGSYGYGQGIYCSGTLGSVAVTGEVVAMEGPAIYGSGPSITITGNVTGGTTSTKAHGIYSSGGQVTVTGNVTGGATAHGIYHSGGAVVTGTVTGGSGSGCFGIYSPSGETTVLGDLHASAHASAICTYQNTKAQHLNGNEYDHAEGWTAVSVNRRLLGTHIGSVHRIAVDGEGAFVTRSVDPDHANPADVRHGTLYASGTRIGTCHVPPPESVAAGTPVDDTVGAAVLTGAQVPSAADIAAAVRSNLEVELSRLANCATVDSTGEQIAAFESA